MMQNESKNKYKIARKAEMNADYTIDQRWEDYTAQDHALWKKLHGDLLGILEKRACKEYKDGLKEFGDVIGSEGIPRFDAMNEILMKKTGWQVVAVPGAVPVDAFFEHLANRRFVSTNWMRSPEQMEYLEEPDVFHDIFGHVPLLLNPVFADYMAAYGRGGLKARELGGVKYLGRLYWYTVEFGLIKSKSNDDELRIYGAGVLSSTEESVYSLESSKPNRVGFDIERIMQTDFDITNLQEMYFVVDSFEQLFEATAADFTKYYDKLKGSEPYQPQDLITTDSVLTRGDIAVDHS